MKSKGTLDRAAWVRARLLNLARQRGEDFQITLRNYLFERFRYRLGRSPRQVHLEYIDWRGKFDQIMDPPPYERGATSSMIGAWRWTFRRPAFGPNQVRAPAGRVTRINPKVKFGHSEDVGEFAPPRFSKHMRTLKFIVERRSDGFLAYPLGLKGVVMG